MNTLIYVSCLGFFCMIAEILNQRKLIIPVLVLALAVIFGLNLSDWNHGQTYFNNMVQVDNFSVAFSGLAIFITLLLFILAQMLSSKSKLLWFFFNLTIRLGKISYLDSFKELNLNFIINSPWIKVFENKSETS